MHLGFSTVNNELIQQKGCPTHLHSSNARFDFLNCCSRALVPSKFSQQLACHQHECKLDMVIINMISQDASFPSHYLIFLIDALRDGFLYFFGKQLLRIIPLDRKSRNSGNKLCCNFYLLVQPQKSSMDATQQLFNTCINLLVLSEMWHV